MTANAARARALVREAVPRLGKLQNTCPQACDHALDHALITAPTARDPALMAKLGAVAGRVLGHHAPE
jgi:5'-methylthioadenosine phosphorylase